MVVKLTTPWSLDYIKQLSTVPGAYGEFKFEINNECDVCDWWVIWGGVSKEESARVSKNRVIYITDEAHNQRSFNYDFLNQFPLILSVRDDIKLSNVIQIHELAPWYFNKSYDELVSLTPPLKSKDLSIVCSDLTWLPGHKSRYAFVNKLIGHFKDRIDVYGRGFNHIPDKFDALIDYKYSIAIENNSIHNYFTEKISECFLTYTLPIYYGCPNITDYYDDRSFININIEDYKLAINQIEGILDSDLYLKSLPFIIDSRKKYLNNYHLFPAIINQIENLSKCNITSSSKTLVTILPEDDFNKRTYLKNLTIKNAGKTFLQSILYKIK